MDLVRHLQYFVAVAEERHFGRAAAALGVTQPPVSRTIKTPEKHLGVVLVERTPDGAVITEHGAALLPRARLIVDDASRLTTTAESLTASEAVRIGLIPQLDDALAARIAASVGVQARVETGGAVPRDAGSSRFDTECALPVRKYYFRNTALLDFVVEHADDRVSSC